MPNVGKTRNTVMHSTSIPLFLIVASLVSTSLGLHHLEVTVRRSLEIILPRQTTSGPCDSICAPFQATLNTCTTTSCLCTVAVADDLQLCVDCAVQVDPSVSVVSDAQSLIDSFTTGCATVAGLPSVTIPTGTAVGTLNTSPVPVSTPPGVVPSTSTAIIVPLTTVLSTTISQIVIGPSSTTNPASTASIGGLPLKGSASPSKLFLHWTGALLGLATGILLAF